LPDKKVTPEEGRDWEIAKGKKARIGSSSTEAALTKGGEKGKFQSQPPQREKGGGGGWGGANGTGNCGFFFYKQKHLPSPQARKGHEQEEK